MSLLKNVKVTVVAASAAAAQTEVVSSVLDMTDYDGVMFIAMLYMAKSWQVQAPDLDAKLDKAVSDFEIILKELEARGTPNEEIANAQRR